MIRGNKAPISLTHPAIAKELHLTKNRFTCNEVAAGSHVKAWKCSEGHIWEATVNDRTGGHGCKKCGDIESGIKRSKTTSEFVYLAALIHSGIYDYSESVYVNKNTKIKIGCPIHGFWESTLAGSHIRGIGCPKCGIDKVWQARRGQTIKLSLSKEDQKRFDILMNGVSKFVNETA